MVVIFVHKGTFPIMSPAELLIYTLMTHLWMPLHISSSKLPISTYLEIFFSIRYGRSVLVVRSADSILFPLFYVSILRISFCEIQFDPPMFKIIHQKGHRRSRSRAGQIHKFDVTHFVQLVFCLQNYKLYENIQYRRRNCYVVVYEQTNL